MALETLIHRNGTLVANGDLSTKQFYACKIDSSGKIALSTVAGEALDGILQNKPTDGQVADLALVGRSKAVAGGTIAAGDLVCSDGTGKLITAHGADRVVGKAIRSAVSGDVFDVEISESKGFAEHGPHFLAFPLDLASIADGDIIAAVTPGYAGRIKKVFVVTNKPATTGAKASTLTPKIGTTALTGGVAALTSANQTPMGNVVAGTAVTALNTFGATDTIKVTASSTTTFVEGSATLFIEFA